MVVVVPPPQTKKNLYARVTSEYCKMSKPYFQQTAIHAPFEARSPVGHGTLHLFSVGGYSNMLPPWTAHIPPLHIFGRPFLQYSSIPMMHHLNTTESSSHLAQILHKMKTWIWGTCNLIAIFRITNTSGNIYAMISYTCKKTWPTRHNKEQSKEGNVK